MRVEDGLGWRLVVDPARHPFPVLVGGASWAVELTAAEAQGLASGISALLDQHHRLATQLMAEEDLELDWERDHLWVGLTLHQGHWSLRFVLEAGAGQRSVEGGWDQTASPALAQALQAASTLLSGADGHEADGLAADRS